MAERGGRVETAVEIHFKFCLMLNRLTVERGTNFERNVISGANAVNRGICREL